MKRLAKEYLIFGMLCCAMSAHADEVDNLGEITVTGSDDPSSLEAAPPLGYGLSGKSAAAVPGSGGDPLRGLQTLPGIMVNSDTSAEPAVRGSRPEDNRYFVDFLPSGYLFHMGGAVSVINPQLVESFDLYPAAYGAQYAGTTGAVIDTRLRDPRSDSFATTLDISLMQAGMLVEGPVNEQQSFYFAARMSYLDLLLDGVMKEDGVDMVQFPRYVDYQGKYLWKLDNGGRVSLQANGAADEMEVKLDGSSSSAENEPLLIGTHSNDASYNNLGLVWEDSLWGSDIKMGIGHMTTDVAMHAASVSDTTIHQDKWHGRGRINRSLGDNHLLAFGGDVARYDVNYNISYRDPGCTEFEVNCTFSDAAKLASNARVMVTMASLYAEDTWFATDNIAFTAGAATQYEDYLDDRYVEPRLRVEYSPQLDWKYSAAVGRYHQFPQFIQVEKVFGNPQLTHFDATHYVVGVEHQLGNGWEWKSEVYYKKLDNLVSSDPVTRYNNSGEGDARGLELLLRKAPNDKLSGWLSLSLSNAERINTVTDERFPFEYDQPVVLNLVADYRLNERWGFGAKWWFHSGVPYTPITGSTFVAADPVNGTSAYYVPVYGEINSERMPDYHRLDLRFNRYFNKKTSGYIEVVNAYARNNVGGYDYSADYSSREPVYQLPMLVSLGFTHEF